MYRRCTNRKPSETRRLRLLRHCRRVASARVATSVNVVERGLRLNKVIGALPLVFLGSASYGGHASDFLSNHSMSGHPWLKYALCSDFSNTHSS